MKAMATDMARWVRIACALALLCVGLVHQPPVVPVHLSAADLAAFTLPDGTVPVLCLPAEDGEQQHHQQAGKPCEICRLSASVLLPAPTDEIGAPLSWSRVVAPPIRCEAFYRQLFPPNTAPRGPPAGLTV